MKSTLFKICFVLFVIGAVILRWVDQTPPGIIAFELAKTIENANHMVAQWEQADVMHLKKFSLYFDYLFIVGYAGSLFIILKEWFEKSQKAWLQYFIWVPVIAGVLDGIENFGLLQIIYYDGTQFSASLAFYCASIKFIILLPSILFALFYLYKKYRKSI